MYKCTICGKVEKELIRIVFNGLMSRTHVTKCCKKNKYEKINVGEINVRN